MTIDALVQVLESYNNIALISHINPDGDTIGSCLALYWWLKSINKSVDLYCQDAIPNRYLFLQNTDQFKQAAVDTAAYDLVIAVDCSDAERMGNCGIIFNNCSITVNIDHHISNTFFGLYNYVDTEAAATGEIIYMIISKCVAKIEKYAAEALYTAISTDTGNFSYSNTTSRTFEIASKLLDSGIDIEELNNILYKYLKLEEIRLLSKALNSLEMYSDNKIAILSLTHQDFITAGAQDSDSENIVNYAKNINSVELGIFLRETAKGYVKASFRSRDLIDSSKLAARFGGGGHKQAAGATIYADILKAKNMILDEALKLIRS